MTDRISNSRYPRLAAVAAVLSMIGLGGCANVGDSYLSGAFVDPAIYDFYTCQQLDATRKSLVTQIANQQKLIDKARTGAAGTVVGELVYRDDYTKLRASAKLADEVWQRDKCDAEMAVAAAPTAKPAQGAVPAPAGTAPPQRRSGNAVY